MGEPKEKPSQKISNVLKTFSSTRVIFLLITILIIFQIVFPFFKSNLISQVSSDSSFITNVVSILTIILTILILIGFQLMINVNEAVERWDEQLKDVTQKNNLLRGDLEGLKNGLEYVKFFKDKWLIDTPYDIFKNVTQNLAHTYEIIDKRITEDKEDKSESQEQITSRQIVADAFLKSWEFSQNAADLFRPIRGGNLEEIEEIFIKVKRAIDFLCNQNTMSSCEILWARLEVSDKILEYLKNSRNKMEKNCENSEEVKLLNTEIVFEEKIKNHLSQCYFKYCH